VVCDIAPMGIAAAKRAGIPCVLVENFNWDWIYEEYTAEHQGFSKYIDYLKTVISSVDYHVQTAPVCRPCTADLTACPVSRKPRTPASRIRKKLGLHAESKVVLVTAGGIPSRFPWLERLPADRGLFFLIPGAGETIQVRENVICLPHRSGFFHPDLVNASDVVVGKAGYSTVAEIFWAGVPFGHVSRRGFRESAVLASFIEQNMRGLAITEEDLYEGSWVSRVPELLSMKRLQSGGVNGADQIAEEILRWIRN
jgi:UDP-N-acetylglucosamine:LPS N-acetylglucosamine transferase